MSEIQYEAIVIYSNDEQVYVSTWANSIDEAWKNIYASLIDKDNILSINIGLV